MSPAIPASAAASTAAPSDYQMRISGPLMDRIDLRIEVPAVTAADLILPPPTRRLGRSRRPRRRRPRHPARALRRCRHAACPHQCRSAGLAAGNHRAAGCAGPKTAARRRRNHAAHRRAAITACCASPARSPTSTARKRSAGCIWPKRCRIARWPRICGARPRAFQRTSCFVCKRNSLSPARSRSHIQSSSARRGSSIPRTSVMNR